MRKIDLKNKYDAMAITSILQVDAELSESIILMSEEIKNKEKGANVDDFVELSMFKATRHSTTTAKRQLIYVLRNEDDFYACVYKYQGFGAYIKDNIKKDHPVVGEIFTERVKKKGFERLLSVKKSRYDVLKETS